MSKNAIMSYNVVGTVEDMTDFVTALDPDQTLLTSKFGKTTVTSTEHNWLCDSLRPAKMNKTKEAVDFSTSEATPRKRASNYVQQFMHGYGVTDITQAVKKYGVRDEKAYQMVKAGKEIGRDLEYAIVANKEKVLIDSAETEGMLGGIPYFLGDFKEVTIDNSSGIATLKNHNFVHGDVIILHATSGTLDKNFAENTQYFVHRNDKDKFTIHPTAEKALAGTDPIKPSAAVNSNTVLTHCNALDCSKMEEKGEFTFNALNDAMQAAWKRGGSINVAVMSGKNKRKASGFTQGTMKTRTQQERELTEVIDVIETDFGRIDLVAHRLYEDDVVDLLELQYWKLGYLIPFHIEDVPRKGTYEEKVLTGVATLECTAPIASARLYNVGKKA